MRALNSAILAIVLAAVAALALSAMARPEIGSKIEETARAVCSGAPCPVIFF